MKSRSLATRTVVIVLAGLLGVLIASYGRIHEFIARQHASSDDADYPLDTADAAGQSANRTGAVTLHSQSTVTGRIDPDEPMPPFDSTVQANNGVVLTPELADGEFVGYRVVQSGSDPRFAAGDIIVAVNGNPAEHSAAGSELVIAALDDPQSEVSLRGSGD